MFPYSISMKNLVSQKKSGCKSVAASMQAQAIYRNAQVDSKANDSNIDDNNQLL